MGGAGAELGEGPPVLEVGEAVLDRCLSDGEDPALKVAAQALLVKLRSTGGSASTPLQKAVTELADR